MTERKPAPVVRFLVFFFLFTALLTATGLDLLTASGLSAIGAVWGAVQR